MQLSATTGGKEELTWLFCCSPGAGERGGKGHLAAARRTNQIHG